ncbi:DUF5801 repeats-in-toxin domain-containing protein [Orrella daihaiensis]|uniref:DUF5801 domain-containing protein n=1 Tax=Orrella daihaiensis TaxID=2782176 RepID=A0ABY4AHM5_9BURK|nr:DUF5801 repeats-in-toxin domain-containing protein [Orrella daihaiensis]UOD49791.1 hypothetical protein DHf2319_10060 [Orrella daihaiensis]
MSKLPVAGRLSLVNELQDSFSSHTVLYGHAGHKPMGDASSGLSQMAGVDVRRPDSDDDVLADVASARGVSPGGRTLEPMAFDPSGDPDPTVNTQTSNQGLATESESSQQSDPESSLEIWYTGNHTSLDESVGLQNAELGTTVRDRDDHDAHVDALPAAFVARLIEMGLGDPAHAALTGFNGFIGGNAFEFESQASTVVMSLVDAQGQTFFGTDSGLRTVTGEAIYLYSDTHNPAIVYGTTALGDVVMAVYLEHTDNSVQGGALWSILYQPLEHPDPTDTDEAVDLSGLVFAQISTANTQDLHDIPSGNHLFFMVGDAQSGYVVTGKEPANQSAGQQINKGDTVNVSQANGVSSLGVNNQMIDPEGEGLFITFVNDPNPSYTGSELSQTEADREANIQFGSLRSVNSAYFMVSQTQPAVRDATVEVAAWQTNAGTGENFIDSSVINTPVQIERVRVLDRELNVLEDSNGSVDSTSIAIDIQGGVATVTGVQAGYWIEYQTVADHQRVSITNPDAERGAKAAAFDVGGFSTGTIELATIEVGQLLQFEDDAPLVGPALTDYINTEVVEIDGEQQTVMRQSGGMNVDYGSDGSDGFRWIETGAPEGFSYIATGNLLDVYQGDTLLLSVEFDPDTNQYQATQHVLAQGSPGSAIELPLFYEVVDRDGDSAIGELALVPEMQILTGEPPTLNVSGNRVALDESNALQNLANSTSPGDQDDNDIDTSQLPINMVDRLQAIGAGMPAFAALSGYDGVAGKPLAQFTGDLSTLTGLSFSDAMGMPLDGDESGLFTVDGEPIYLYTDTVDPGLLLGKTGDGDVVLAAYIEIQTASAPGVMMWTALYEPLQHPDPTDADEAVDLSDRVFIKTGGQTTYDLSDVKPGQYLFFMTGNENAALVYTGKQPANQSEGQAVNSGDTVNPSAATSTTVGTNNQMIDPPTYDKFGEVVKPAEGVVVSFVSGANPAYTGVNLSPGEAVVEANIQFTGTIEAFQASFVISQLQPVKSATVEVSAWHTEAQVGTQFVDGLLADDMQINVTRVTVYDQNGVVLEDSNGSVQSSDIEITIINGVANIAGVNPGYQIEYYTDEAHNRVLVENAGSRNENLNASFDLGAFTLVQTSSAVTEIGSAMVFEDDGVTGSINDPIYLDDDAMAGGNPGGIDDQDPDVVAVSGVLTHGYGVDQPGSITWLTDGAPAGFTYEASGSDLVVKQGVTTVMTLSLDSATGAYSVTQNAAIMHEAGMDENDATFRVGYRVTDADGDSTDGSISIEVDDDTPTVSENAMVYLDDDAMAGGNPGGIDDQDPDQVAATGVLGHSFGADQPGSIAWLTDGAPAGFTYEASGSDLLVKQGATTVMTLSLDSATGAYSVTQNAAIMHEAGMDENNQPFTVGYRVTDADGDSTDGSISIEVDDDTPTVSENAMVYLDDDAMAGGNPGGIDDQDPDQVAATGVLGHSFGADQPGSIAWLTDGAPAGFTYEASGSDLLVKQGATTVMTLSLDSATGAYSVTQNAAIMHEAGMDENDATFRVGYRVTDADGDSTDGSISIEVDDDTPTVSENAMVYLDDDAMAGGNPGGIDDQDPDVVAATGTLSHSFGADQPGSIAWLTDGAPAGFSYEASGSDLLVKQGAVTVLTLSLDAATGAYAVTQNAAIMHEAGMDENDATFRVGYRVTDADGDSTDGSISIEVDDDTPTVSENAMVYLDDDAMAGGNPGGIDDQDPDVVAATGTLSHSFGADQPGSIAWLTDGAPAGFSYEASGSDLLVKQGAVTVLTLSLDAATGAYAVTQNAAIISQPGLDENNQPFTVGYRVTDADGDAVDGSISIEVDDDTPTVSENATVYLDDDAMAGGNPGGIDDQDPDIVMATGVLGSSVGADQPGSIVWLTDGAPAGFTYEASGSDLLVKQGATTVMTLNLDSATGAYSVVQNAAIMHEAGMDENNQPFTVGYRVTDADGDSTDGSISIEVDDDTPTVSENAMVYLDDDAMAGGNPGGIDDQDPDQVAATGVLGHSFGADQPGSIAWLTDGAPAGFTYEASGSDLLVKQGATTVMTLSLDSATGAYSVTQNAAIMHEAGMDENDATFRVGYRVTDADGDSTDGSISIEVDDDTPTVSENAMVYLDDDAMAGGNAGGIGDQDPDQVAATGVLGHSFGADQPGSIVWLTDGAPAGFTYEASGSDLLVKQGATTVMTLNLDSATGAYSVVQNAAIMHEAGMDENDATFRVGYRVTDADGDSVDGSISVNVDDDTPTVSENATVYLDDDAMAGGNPGGIDDQDPDQVAATGVLGHSFGADQPGSIAWLTDGAPAGFTYEASGSDLLVKQGVTTVMTLSLDSATGAYSVTQNAAIMHEAGMDENNQPFTVGYRVTDADGDSTDGSISIEADDDTPTVSENATVYLDDDAMAGGNPGGVGDQDPDVVAATGTLSHSFGADQPGSIAWLTDGAPAGFSYESSGSDLLVKQGAVTVLTLSLDAATGAYAVTQNAAIISQPGLDENNQPFTVGYRVTDADGDAVDGSISIEVDDDTPTVSENATVYLDDDAMAGGNPGGIDDQDPDQVAATGVLGHSFGADQPGSIAWLTDGAPAGFTYEASGSDLLVKQGVTTVMTLSLDSATGAYSVTQNAAIMHEAGMDENDATFRVGYRVTDADGDSVDGSISVNVDDDTPTVSENAMVYLDDDAMAGGNAGGIGDQDPDQVAATGVLGHSFGADQPGSIAWLTDGAPAGFSYEASGSDLLVKQGAVTVLTLSLDAATGAYAVTQNAVIMHEAGMDENDATFRVGYRVTDADGDAVDGSISIEVDDDTPSVSENATVYLDDDAMAGGNAGGIGDQDPDQVAATGVLGHSFGADQPGSIAWLTDGAPAGFTYEASGSDLLVKQGATTVMTLSLDSATGAYSVVQNATIMHEAGMDENNQPFTVGYRVTDADGDSTDGSISIEVDDDTPTVSENATVYLDDDAMAGGNPGGIDDQDPDQVAATGVLGHSFGADQPGSIVWLTDGAPAGFTYEASGSDLLVKQGAVTVLTLSLDAATGAYAVTQNAAIISQPGLDENNQPFTVGYRVTDADGDAVDGSISIEVDDDTPTVSENATVYLDDDAMAGGNPGGIDDQDPDIVMATGVLGSSVGADQPGSIAWLTDGAPAGFTYEASGSDLLVKQGAVTVLTLSLDAATGAYAVTQNAVIMHEAGMDENDATFRVGYRVTDADGDSVDGSISITVDDDTPTVSENATVYLDDDAMAGGNAGGIGDQDPDQVAATGVLGHSFGADQPGSIVWLTDGAPAGFTYEASGSDLLVKQGAVTVLTLSLDAATGAYAVTQNAAIISQPGLDENNQPFTVGYRVTDADGDAVDGSISIEVDDDTPTVSENATVYLDDDAMAGGNPGGIDDQDPDIVMATGVLGSSVGADQPGSIAWLTDGAPAGFTYEASGSDLLVKQGATTVMTLSLDSATGAYSVVQNAPVQHDTAFDENEVVFDVAYRVSDVDGDSVDGLLSIVVDDDTPVVNEVTGVTYLNSENPNPGASGVFDYSVGADSRTEYSATDTDLLMFRLTGTVGVNSITNSSITWVSETDEAALFRVGFDYQPSESSVEISTASGYIEFDKVDGSYQFWLDEPLQGFSISTTSSALGFTGYEVNSETTDKTQPAVVVAQLTNSLYAQFSGYSEPGGGTGVNNLQALGVDTDPGTFVNGEQFVQAASYVSVSNVANGVAGDTLQKGEVLNFTLHNSNPYGYLDQPATEYADSMFLKFDGIGSTEDLVVVLSLINPDTMDTTTRALIVDSSDILKFGNPITPEYRIVLDNNDGAIIIENNDFNSPGESYLITGAQVLVSVEGVAGEGIEFNSSIGEEGASTAIRPFGVTETDSDVVKISDIGVMTQSSATLSAELQIDLAVVDTDFDASVTQAIDISILGSAMAPLDTTV